MSQYKLSMIPDNGSKALCTKRGEYEIGVIVIRKGDRIFCYHNICPHTGVNLNWLPDQFLDTSGDLIQCATHGALFRIEDGYCISGPCAGQNLWPMKVKVENGMFEILWM